MSFDPNRFISKEAKQSQQSLEEKGLRQNTELAKSKDIEYFWSWAKVVHDVDEYYPIDWQLLFDFTATHLDGSIPLDKDQILVASRIKSDLGYHKVSTVKRRLSTLSKHHKNLGHVGASNPCGNAEVLALINNAKKLDEHANRPSPAAVKEIVDSVMKTIPNDLPGLRDKAMMYVAFGAGGRRRSEVVGMQFKHIKEVLDSCYIISIKGSKNQKFADEELLVKIEGQAKKYLDKYIKEASINTGPLFRAFKPKTSIITARGLSDSQFYRIVKKRFLMSGVAGAEHFTPHSFRSGFVTEQGKRGKNKYDGMAATGHKSQKQYDQYYQSGATVNNKSTNLD